MLGASKFLPNSPAWLAVFSMSAAMLVSVPIWYISTSRSSHAPSPFAEAVFVQADTAAHTDAILGSDPLTHYFGVPLKGHTIGYVVDGDETMAPYIDQIASVTNAVNAAIPPDSRRFGVVQAVGDNGQTLLEVAEPVSGLEGARSVLQSRLPTGKTDLTKAITVAANWSPDQVFLVLSKPLTDEEVTNLRISAESTRAVVNVIAVGGAAKQDLSLISESTGGKFLTVSDAALAQLVQRQAAAAPTVQ